MRSFSPATWLLLGFLLALASCTAFAETIPATYNPPSGSSGSSGYAIENTSGWFCGGGTKRDDPETACDYCSGQYVASRHAAESFTYATENGINVNGYKCRTAVELGDGLVANITPSGVGTCPSGMTSAGTYTCSGSCPAGQEIVNGVCTAGTYSCPTTGGWTLEGQSCVRTDCEAGEIRNEAGSCVREKCTAGTKLKSGYFSDSNGDGITPRACISGCWGTFKGGGPTNIYWGAYHSTPVYIGDYVADGATCDTPTPPEDPTTAPPDQPATTDSPEYDCASQGMTWGTVNGVVICQPPSSDPDAPPVITPEKKTETAPDNTKTETSTTDVQAGDSITRTTTVVTYNAAGEVVSTTSSSTTANKGSFCEENPNASVCKDGKVSGGGGCDAPPVCSGDAVSCATLRQQWEARCEIKKQNDFVATPGEPGVFESKTTAIDAKKTELGNLIDQIRGEAAGLFTFSGAGNATLGCDAGVTTTQGFHVELCFSKYDDELQMIGAVLVFVSLVIAVFIMFS